VDEIKFSGGDMQTARIGLLLSLYFLSVPVRAQQSTATDSQAQTTLQKSFGSLVGPATIKDVSLAGTVRRIAGSDDETGSVILRALASGEARMDSSFPSGQRSEIRAELQGGPAGNWIGPDGTLHEASQHNCWTDATWFFPAFLSAYGGSANAQAVYIGPETRNSESVLHLRSTKVVPGDRAGNPSSFVAQLSQTEIYLDSQSYLPVAITFNIHPDTNGSSDIPVEIRYSGYRTVNGSQVPFHVQEYVQNGLTRDITITSATFNSGLTSSEFPVQ
jgi:hypothetical protein